MARWRIWFECLGKAFCAGGVRALMGLVPLGEVLYEIASHALGQLRERSPQIQEHIVGVVG